MPDVQKAVPVAKINCWEVLRSGGRVKRGIVEKGELEGDVEVRVSMRSSKILGSVELFTIRKLEPKDYYIVLVAVPRDRDARPASAPRS